MFDPIPFLQKVTHNLKTQGFSVENKEIDHLCYRTSSNQNYEQIKKKFEAEGILLIESEVNGRLIATYKLQKPIQFEDWVIDLIEVPAPKPNKETKVGYEHIEVVIDESFDDFINQHPKTKFSTKGMNKDLNPELEIKFEDCAVKFHHKSLEHIINIEKNSLIVEFLESTQILSKLKDFTPCISGTLPLGIQTKNSDLDILFCTSDLDRFLAIVKNEFGDFNNFEFHESENQGLKSLVINFDFKSLPVELFAQDKDSFQQRANQHFLIEGRLLKLLGVPFLSQVKQLKEEGVKTEPAIGKILGLKEPYQELVDLNKLRDRDLLFKYASVFTP
jgi:predicted metalloenzyme YecM